jgi:hypothetical protein
VATSLPTPSEIAMSENKAPRSHEKVSFRQRDDLLNQGWGVAEGQSCLAEQD